MCLVCFASVIDDNEMAIENKLRKLRRQVLDKGADRQKLKTKSSKLLYEDIEMKVIEDFDIDAQE